jgi:hypothetical protein
MQHRCSVLRISSNPISPLLSSPLLPCSPLHSHPLSYILPMYQYTQPIQSPPPVNLLLHCNFPKPSQVTVSHITPSAIDSIHTGLYAGTWKGSRGCTASTPSPSTSVHTSSFQDSQGFPLDACILLNQQNDSHEAPSHIIIPFWPRFFFPRQPKLCSKCVPPTCLPTDLHQPVSHILLPLPILFNLLYRNS